MPDVNQAGMVKFQDVEITGQTSELLVGTKMLDVEVTGEGASSVGVTPSCSCRLHRDYIATIKFTDQNRCLNLVNQPLDLSNHTLKLVRYFRMSLGRSFFGVRPGVAGVVVGVSASGPSESMSWRRKRS